MEMDTNLLYLELAEKEVYDCIRSEKMQDWDLFCGKDCNDLFTAGACSNLIPRKSCAKHKTQGKRERTEGRVSMH